MASPLDRLVVIPESGSPAQTAESLTSISGRLLGTLPSYASVAAAQSAGLVTGDYFVLTGVTVGILTLNMIVRVP